MFNPETEKRKCPTQLVYASSQDDMNKMFYKHYKNFAKHMLAGDRDYFVADMICDCAITTYMNGKLYTPSARTVIVWFTIKSKYFTTVIKTNMKTFRVMLVNTCYQIGNAKYVN